MPYAINAQGVFQSDMFGNQKKVIDFFNPQVNKEKQLVKLCNSLGNEKKRILNGAPGAEIAITNLTYIHQQIVMQKHYTVTPSEFIPVAVGEGAFMTHTINYRVSPIGDGGGEQHLLNMGSTTPRESQAGFVIDSLQVEHKQYLSGYSYNIFDINQLSKIQASESPITLKEKARKMEWDLMIQKTAFLGLASDPNVIGLLNIPGVYTDTATLTVPLSQLSTDDFVAVVSKLCNLFYNNSNMTSLPTDLYLPPFDYLALPQAVSPIAPFNTRLEYMLNALRVASGNPNFNIKMLAYCDKNRNNLGVNRSVLMNKNPDVARISVPIDYTTTIVDTTNGFEWFGSSYGQFTGVIANRTQEIYYLDYAGSYS